MMNLNKSEQTAIAAHQNLRKESQAMKAHETKVYRGIRYTKEHAKNGYFYFWDCRDFPMSLSELEATQDVPRAGYTHHQGVAKTITELKSKIDKVLTEMNTTQRKEQ